jgi:hypothetical protein
MYREMIWTTGATAWRTVNPSWQASTGGQISSEWSIIGSSAPSPTTTRVDDAVVAAFLVQMEEVLMTHPATRVFNMDETSWRLINNQMSTLA